MKITHEKVEHQASKIKLNKKTKKISTMKVVRFLHIKCPYCSYLNFQSLKL